MSIRFWATALLACAACNTTESTAPGDAAPQPAWHQLDGDEPLALLAVWGERSDDVWVVGSRASAAAGPTILRYDGAAWTRVDSGQTSLDLWWVFGFAGGDVLFGGSGGTILRFRDGAFERLPTPSTAGTIFGIWGAAPDDIWAVGDAGTAGGVAWHYDGQSVTAMPLPDPAPRKVFKVHGQASNDVWMACDGGITLHWDGVALARVPTPTVNSLFSIITTPERVVAVGGVAGMGEVLENTGSGWVETQQLPITWRGTAALGNDVAVVGESGVAALSPGSGWQVVQDKPTPLNFHSAWLDENHGLWAVGGVFDGELSNGLLLYYGLQSITEVTR